MNGLGQDFSDFMKEQGLYEDAQELATKKVIAAQLKAEMEKQLGDEWAAVQAVINTAASGYETAKATVEKQYEKDQAKLDADLRDITARRDALDEQIKQFHTSRNCRGESSNRIVLRRLRRCSHRGIPER